MFSHDYNKVICKTTPCCGVVRLSSNISRMYYTTRLHFSTTRLYSASLQTDKYEYGYFGGIMRYLLFCIIIALSSVSKAETITPTLVRSSVVQTHKLSELCIIEHIVNDYSTKYCNRFKEVSMFMTPKSVMEIQNMLYKEYIKSNITEDEIQYVQILIYRIQRNAVYIKGL